MIKLSLIRRGDPSMAPIEHREFNGGKMTIGRGDEADWSINDPTRYISKVHCEIYNRGNDCFVVDHSTNGAFLNGAQQRMTPHESFPLKPGDEISFGEYVVLIAAAAAPLPKEGFGGSAIEYLPPAGESGQWTDQNAVREGITDLGKPSAIDDLIGEIGGDIPSDPFANEAPLPPVGRGEISEPMVPPQPKLPVIDSADLQIPESWDNLSLDKPTPKSDPLTDLPATPEPVPSEDIGAGFDGSVGSIADRQTTEVAARAFQAFLDGADLDPNEFTDFSPEDVMRNAGRAYRQAVLNYSDILRDRSFLKNEYRLERTILERRENNPLKFSDPQTAAVKLLKPAEKGFLDGAAAIKDAGQDIKKHQFAVLAGLRFALTALLDRLRPSSILKSITPDRGPMGIIGGQGARQRQAWEKFEEHYKFCEGEASSTAGGFVNEAFRDGYEQQMSKLNNSG